MKCSVHPDVEMKIVEVGRGKTVEQCDQCIKEQNDRLVGIYGRPAAIPVPQPAAQRPEVKAMREAGKAAEPKNEPPTCALCHEEYYLRDGMEPTKYCDDCAHRMIAKLEALPEPPPAAERGEPTCHICGWAASDCSCAGTKDIRIQEAYERGFNACREMAAMEVEQLHESQWPYKALNNVAAVIRNLKLPEGK